MRTSPDRTIDISVVVICYNQERTVAAALDSVLTQTARDRIGEIFVVDDSSTDGYAGGGPGHGCATSRDHALSLRRPIAGAARHLRNEGHPPARGNPLWPASIGDDTWHPDKIATLISGARSCPGIGLLLFGPS